LHLLHVLHPATSPRPDADDALTECIAPTNSEHNLLSLPAEIIDHILSFLPPLDLAILSLTSRQLSSHAKSDLVWHRHVQENVPGVKVTSPFPCSSYRELYMCHDPHWFIPKYKIWFSDYYLTGMLVIGRYDPRRGCIEAYRLVAERAVPTFVPWEQDDEVLIHSFTPRCRLHLDQPVVHLGALSPRNFSANKETGRIRAETSMTIAPRSPNRIYSNLLLAKPIRPDTDSSSSEVWPPRIIPARHRFLNITQRTVGVPARIPQTRAEVSNQAFRIRKWMEMSPGRLGSGVHLGEEIFTYSTLDPKLYTPTEEKPWRGIWVGDFSGHGCEFLLINQPDNETPFDEASVVQRDEETVEEWEKRKREEKLYRGCLEAIKLTGDPNVPRGEYTFIADDISSNGYLRTATEERFQGARIVKSRGHIASRMFRDGRSPIPWRCCRAKALQINTSRAS
jgi:hypothetical protein